MGVSTLIRYMLGNRRAILAVANSRRAVWLGMLFVISAGLAREYDAEDLLHAPWYAMLPLAASLATSFVLFLLLETVSSPGDRDGGQSGMFLAKYRVFLSLYWLTAPLAWLYAFPVERLLSAADAVRVNLWMLGIVSVWRVALMTRVVSVIYSRSTWASFFLVMLFADSVALVIFWLTPLPILSIMGGIGLTESEGVIQATGFLVRFCATVTWPVWFSGAGITTRDRSDAGAWREVDLSRQQARPITSALWLLCASSILIWIAILPFTQHEQINRRRAETDLRKGRVREAIDFMSQRRRDEFPPHWDPPPRVGYGETQPSIVDVLLHLERVDAAPWVRQLFRDKLVVQSQADPWSYYGHAIRLDKMDDEQLARYVELLASLPEGPAMALYHEAEIGIYLDSEEPEDEAARLSGGRRASMEAILKLVPDDAHNPDT